MFTKRMSRSLALAAALTGLGLASQQALATSQTGHANAVILQAITVTENTQLNYADISAPAGGGTVTVTAAATPSETGTGFTFLGTPAAGQFTATGSASQTAVITFSTGDTLSDGAGHTMNLGNYTTDAGSSPAFNSSGNLVFHVGADLTVGANQVAGTYTGTYTVTVNY
ncbi:MAG TPA: DUF4402 domain-containing protein [Stellaceae bacterium]|nr:DUF4402 domain-containing protein [Stellaceae bacterium]